MTTLALMKQTGEEMQQYAPVPKEAGDLNGTLVYLGQDLVYIADEYTAGVDGRDPARLSNAVARMQGVFAKASLATQQIQALSH